MFPSVRQRVVVFGGVAAAGCLYLSIEPLARAADGRDGLTMMLAAKPAVAMGAFALVTLAAGVIGGFAGAWGNPLAGVFTLAAGLACVAVAGGPVEPWLRSTASSDIYLRLAGDALMWLALLALVVEMSTSISDKLRSHLPVARRDDPEKARAEIELLRTQLRQRGGWWALLMGEAVAQAGLVTRKAPIVLQHVAGPVAAVVIGSAISMLLLPIADVWQVAWGLGFAYLFATMAAHQLFPECQTTGLLVSPLIAAVLWYLFISAVGGDHDTMLAAVYAGGFWKPGLAMPIHYASAGVAGAAAGIGASQLIWRGRIEQAAGAKKEGPQPS